MNLKNLKYGNGLWKIIPSKNSFHERQIRSKELAVAKVTGGKLLKNISHRESDNLILFAYKLGKQDTNELRRASVKMLL